jgi:hypothetical protein
LHSNRVPNRIYRQEGKTFLQSRKQINGVISGKIIATLSLDSLWQMQKKRKYYLEN